MSLLVVVLGLLVLARADIAQTASNTTPGSRASNTADTITADGLKPSECAGITLTALVYGSGTINGSPGAVNELITGSAAADTINADGGDDCVLAGGGVDVVKGEAGNDVVLADGGDDHLSGGTGDDTLDGEADYDRCYGGSGTNTILNCERTDLDPPSALVASPGAALADIDLTWTASPALLVAGYNIYRSTTAGSGYAFLDSVVGRLTTSYTDSPPDVNGDYFYLVDAYFESLLSAYTNEAARIVRFSAGDARVDEDNPNNNYGSDDQFRVRSESGKLRRGFAKFDLSSVPSGARIDTAYLRARIQDGEAPGSSRTYEAQRAAASWVEGNITWNNQPAVGGSAVTTATGTTGGVWNQWTTTVDVQAFADATATNYGWRIRDQSEGSGSDQTRYHSRESSSDPQVRVFYANGATATVSGSVVPTSTEAGIIAGGKTIVITLTNEVWDATIGQNNSKTTDLINGIDSAQLESNGWDAVVQANTDHNDVVRTSDTVVTITLGAEATYDITATETITVTVPVSAVAGSSPIVATPTFKVVSDTLDIMLLVLDPGSLDANKDVPLREFLETTLGHNVTVRDATSSGWTPTDHDAVVISESVTSADTAWLLSEAVGVLTVEGANWDEFDLGTGGLSDGGDTTVDITDNSHYITSIFSTGTRTVATSGTNMGYIAGWGGGVQKLAHYASASTQAYILAVDKGAALVPSGTAAERRVFLGAQFLADANAAGRTLLERALDWVAYRDTP